MINLNFFVGKLGADPLRGVGLGPNDREPEPLGAGGVQRRDDFRRRRPDQVLARRGKRNLTADLSTNFRRGLEIDLGRKKRDIFRRDALPANVVDRDEALFDVGALENDVDVRPVDDRRATFRRLTFRERLYFVSGQRPVPEVDVGDLARKRVLVVATDLEPGVKLYSKCLRSVLVY